MTLRRGRAMALLGCLILFVSACGEGSEEPGPVSGQQSPSADEWGRSLIIQAGATDEEADCIDQATRSAPQSDLDTQDPGKALEEAITTLAVDCAPPARLQEIALGVSSLIEQEIEGLMEPLLDQFSAQYEAAGASPAEARCMAEALLQQEPSKLDGIYGNAREKARAISGLLLREGKHCASPERLRELAFATHVDPFLTGLQDAGATPRQANCMVTKIENLDIFFPSEDFNGPRAGELAGDRFVENAPGCAPDAQLRAIAKKLFAQYQEGCKRTSEDPMAPYEC